MALPSDTHSSPSPPDHGLPPVEPPSARFILQLFVVPAVIVIIIVLVWLLFNWLAQMGSDPTKYVAALRSNSKARWQAAASLADVLNDVRNAELKRDHRLAQELATLLTDELQRPTDADEQVMLDVYLCRALGEFSVPEVVPPLVEAAGRTRPEDIGVRQAALEGLAVVASNLPAEDNPHASDMSRAIVMAAGDGDAQIRSAAAFALGVLGDSSSTNQLQKMISDVYPDVRYNAATGLARHGHAGAMPVILEMLDPAEQASLKLETDDQAREFKRNLIAVNGLQAAETIYRALPTADQQTLRSAVERLTDKEQPADIRLKATETLRQFDANPAAAPAG
jgi:HEAT repeat protein